jgi:hypothetical protein
MIKLINHLEERNHYSFYLAVFRVFICFHLMKDLLLSINSWEILYSNSSFVHHAPNVLVELINIKTSLFRINYLPLIFIYGFLIICLSIGIGNRITAIILFITYTVLQGMNHLVLNGGDNLLKFILLYMCFADSFQFFTIRNKRIDVKPKINFLNNTASNLAVYAICFHLCLVYFLSALHKIHSDVWFKGIATYYIFNIERFIGTELNYALSKNALFVTVSTYVTILFELVFPILIWNRDLRKQLILAGIFLHVGIYVFMMIYDFEVLFIMTYGFFFSDKEWKNFAVKKIKLFNNKSIYYLFCSLIKNTRCLLTLFKMNRKAY